MFIIRAKKILLIRTESFNPTFKIFLNPPLVKGTERTLLPFFKGEPEVICRAVLTHL